MYLPRKNAQETPDKPAYIMAGSGETVTYKQMEERANRLAHLFRDVGLVFKDHIAFLMENNAEFFIIAWAAQRAGLYYTPISTHLKIDECEYIINNSDSKAFIASMAMSEVAAELIDRIPRVHTRLIFGGRLDGYQSYEERVAAYPDTPIPDEIAGSDMLYSSGTTGRPKGVLPAEIGQPIDEDSPLLLVSSVLFGMNVDSVYLSPAPLYHSAPLRFCIWMMMSGGTVVIMEKFDTVNYLALVEKYRATITQLVPTMFIRMLKLPDEERLKYDISSLQMAIHAAAPCPVPIKEQMIEWWGPILFEYYAGTEGNGFVKITSGEWLSHKGSVGQILAGTIHILDEAGQEMPTGEVGTVYFETESTFEYYKDPEKTAQSRSDEGWTTLGDIGYLDGEGYLYLTDRKADMIISGGVNIYPQEAENIIVMHPKVADVAVFGIPHEEFGEEVKAVVQPVDMDQAGPEFEEEILNFCQQRLARIKCPKSVDFKAELPRSPTGKLLKRIIRDRYWEGRTRTGISAPAST